MIRHTTFALLTCAALALGCQRERPDALVNAAVVARLEREPALSTSEVAATTEDGHVTLTGVVSSDDQRRLAEKVADDVSGVKGVTNQIDVAAGETTMPPVSAPPQEEPEQPIPAPQPEGGPPEGYPLTPHPEPR